MTERDPSTVLVDVISHDVFTPPGSPAVHDEESSPSLGDCRSARSLTGSDIHTADFLRGIAVHIIPAKLSSEEVSHLSQIAEARGASLVNQPSAAEVILTAVSAKKRLERHISAEEARKRLVLRVAWLEESDSEGRRQPFGDYLVLEPPVS